MIGKIQIRERGATPRKLKKAMDVGKKVAYADALALWHRDFRPKHFTVAGATQYGYLPRQGERGNPGSKGFKRSYTGRKLAKFGHTRPLVYTGESEALSRMRDVRTTSKGGKLVIHARKLNFKNPHSKIDMRDEVTRILPQEAQQMTDTFDGTLDRELAKFDDTSTTTV